MHSINKLLPKPRRFPRAFSLVEVVLAMAITVVGLFSMIGLLTVGLKSGRESEDATMAAIFSQEIIRRLQTKPFNAALVPTTVDTEEIFPLPALNTASSQSFFLDADNRPVTDPEKAVRLLRINVNPVLPLASADQPATPPAMAVLSHVTITVAWPAQATANNQQSVSFSTELYSGGQ